MNMKHAAAYGAFEGHEKRFLNGFAFQAYFFTKLREAHGWAFENFDPQNTTPATRAAHHITQFLVPVPRRTS